MNLTSIAGLILRSIFRKDREESIIKPIFLVNGERWWVTCRCKKTEEAVEKARNHEIGLLPLNKAVGTIINGFEEMHKHVVPVRAPFDIDLLDNYLKNYGVSLGIVSAAAPQLLLRIHRSDDQSVIPKTLGHVIVMDLQDWPVIVATQQSKE